MADRTLLPVSVYLPPASIAEAERRASALSIAVGTLLRMILLGQQPPISP